jgi:hypothetical protein
MSDGQLRQLFQKHLPSFHWQSIETWSTGRGVPDANYCYAGSEGWIEMKRAVGWRCKIEPEQIAWLERRARAGGRVFIAVRRIKPPQTFWLFHGNQARLLLGRLSELTPLVLATGNPGSWPWKTIGVVLTD